MKLHPLAVYARHCPVVRFVRRAERGMLTPREYAAWLGGSMLLCFALLYGVLVYT